jgi:RNase P subunit RPR2
MNEKPKKPTIDERIQALTETAQLVFEMQKDTFERFDRMVKRMEVLDQRERKARPAVLAAMTAYLDALNGNGEERPANGEPT